MARDYCLKVYGKSHWKDYTAEQVFTGWLFYYDWWRVVTYKLKAKDKGTPAEGRRRFWYGGIPRCCVGQYFLGQLLAVGP